LVFTVHDFWVSVVRSVSVIPNSTDSTRWWWTRQKSRNPKCVRIIWN